MIVAAEFIFLNGINGINGMRARATETRQGLNA
jgi:hypothetical protein